MTHLLSQEEIESRSSLLQQIGGLGKSRGGRLTFSLPKVPVPRTDSLADICLNGDIKVLQHWYNTKRARCSDGSTWQLEVNIVDKSTGKLPLTLAVLSGSSEIIDFLLQLEADPTARNLDGSTAIHWAIISSNPSILLQFLRMGLDPNIIEWTYGQTPLHIACRMGNDRAAKLLLESPDIKPNLSACNGATPLILAIICSTNSELLRKLVSTQKVNLAQTDDQGRNAIWWAAHLSKTEFCSILLNANAPIHPYAIHEAAKSSTGLDVVNLLLAAGAQANILDANGLAPIHIAALHSNTAILSLLLNSSDVDSNLLSRSGLHCIQYIVAAGSLGSLKGLVAVLPESALLLTADGSSLVHIAASRACPKILRFLLEYFGSNHISLPSHTLSGQTAIDLLYSSALVRSKRSSENASNTTQSDYLASLKLLLGHGASISDSFLFVLRTSVMIGEIETVQYLHATYPDLFVSSTLKLSDLIPSSDCDLTNSCLYLRVMEFLLEIGVVADSYSCLHLAAAGGLLEFVQSFVTKWCFPIDAPSSGPLHCTPLMLALIGSHDQTADWLLSHNASPTATDVLGRMPLHFAAQFSDDLDVFRKCLVDASNVKPTTPSPYHSLAITKFERHAPQKLQLLLQHGFDIMAKNPYDETALHFACSPLGLTSLVQLLVAEGCNQMHPNSSGLTPLHLACLDSNPTKVGVLQFLKPNFNLQTKRTRSTPLHCALRARQTDIAEFLITHQLNILETPSNTCQFQVNLADKKGRTLLHWAASFGDAQLCRLLITEGRANLRLADLRGQTPLHLAAKAGHLFVIKVLLGSNRVSSAVESTGASKAIIDIPDHRGRPALHVAMKYDQVEAVALLLSLGASVVARDNSCRNSLHCAALSASLPIFMLLWNYRAQIAPIINSVDTSSSSALHFAVEKGCLSIVNMLLACCDIDLSLKNQNAETPLAVAQRCGFTEISRAIENVLPHLPLMDPSLHRFEPNKRSTDRLQIHSMTGTIGLRNISASNLEAEIRPKASTLPNAPRRLDLCVVDAPDQSTPQAVSHPAKRFRSAVMKGTLEALNRFWRRYGSRLLYDVNCCVDPARRVDWTALHQYANTANSECMAVLLSFPFINVNPSDAPTTPLHEAVMAGSLACVYLLLEAGADPHAATAEGLLPLHLAVSPNISEALKKLILSHTLERSCADKTGKTAFHLAAQQGDTVMIQCLVEAGVQIDLKYSMGIMDPNPPLHLAVKFGHLECVRLLLNAGANVNSIGAKNRTALHIAAGVDHIDILQLILQKKPQLEAKDEYGLTPFLVACRTGSVSSAEALITAGAAMEATDRDRRGALHQAVEAGAIGILSALVASKRLAIDTVDAFGFSPLHLALQSGNELIAIELTEKCKLDLYKISLLPPQNILGQTELHMAAASGCTSFVRMLLKVGVSRNILDLKLNPPLFYALSRNHIDTAAILLDSPEGSLELVPVRTGKQPLSIVCEHGWADCAEHLLHVRNHSPNWQNADGSIALHACAKSLSIPCLTHILNSNVDVDRLSGSGFSTLHLAILQTSSAFSTDFERNKHQFIELLLQRSSVDLPTKISLQTPLHLAATLGDLVVLRMLIARTSSLNAVDHSGSTALLLAAQNRHRSCYLELLCHGADPLLSSHNKNTVLHELMTAGDYPLAYLLYKVGADIAARRGEDGMSPVQICCCSPQALASDLPDAIISHFKLSMAQSDLPLSGQSFLSRLLEEKPESVGALLCAADAFGRTSAHHAARVGCRPVLELVYQNGVALDTPDVNNQTPLHFASAGKHLDCMKFLLEHLSVASLHVLDGRQNSALHYACDSGFLPAVQLLLPFAFDCTIKNADGCTPLFLAVASGNQELVTLLLSQNFDPQPYLISSDLSLLHIAPSFEITTLLLEKFPSLVFQKDQRGCSPLHYAAVFSTEPQHLQLLIEKGASPADRCDNGWFATHYAALAGNVVGCQTLFPPVLSVLNYSEERLCPFSPLHCAVLSTASTAAEATALLLQLGARVNDRDLRGQSPLHYAALNGHVDRLQILLSAKDVLIDPQDWGGHTPLHLAAMEDHCAAIRLLALKGANLNARTTNGATPLHVAAYANRIDAIHLLLYYGIPLESPCVPGGDTPLMYATQSGAANALEFLMRVGANPRAVNADGNTALHIAAALGDTNIVRLLLPNVPQLTKNNNGDLPIHLAAYFGHTEVIKLLVEASPIVVKYVNSQKFLPLQLAALNHQRQAIPVLLQYGNPDITLKDNYGMTPFHFASISGSEALIRRHLVEIFELVSRRRFNGTLLDAVNSVDKTGYSPLHWSAICPTPEVFGLFCLDTGGGDLDSITADAFRHSVLHLLAGTNNLPALRFYQERVLHRGRLQSRFPVDARGFTPLSLAVNNNFFEVAQLLLEIAFSPTEECSTLVSPESGLTLLHLAVYRRNVQMVKLLLQFHPPVNTLTSQGETALDWAVALKASEIELILIQNNAIRNE